MVRAVLWDFGGVIMSSPFEAFNRFEAERNLPKDFIRQINTRNPDDNAWARFERSDISLDEFDVEFAREAREAGFDVRGRDIIALLSGDLRPEMVEALRRVRQNFKTACLTNNVLAGQGAAMAADEERARAIGEVLGLFDCVLESSKLGVRKPDPRFYRMACDRLGIAPEEAVYLDDLGINLKPARQMGMKTIKVVDPAVALEELEAITGLSLR